MAKKKKLEELTIVDDFMFGAVMSEPKCCKPLLEFILGVKLGVKIERIEYPDLQKTIDKQYKSKSVRLDVYVSDGKGTVGDISEDLKDTLNFIAGKKPKGKYAKDLENAVDEVKKSEKWRREYMTLYMRDKEHERFGKFVEKVSVVRNSGEEVADIILSKQLRVDVALISKMQDLIYNHPDWDDEDIANEILEED